MSSEFLYLLLQLLVVVLESTDFFLELNQPNKDTARALDSLSARIERSQGGRRRRRGGAASSTSDLLPKEEDSRSACEPSSSVYDEPGLKRWPTSLPVEMERPTVEPSEEMEEDEGGKGGRPRRKGRRSRTFLGEQRDPGREIMGPSWKEKSLGQEEEGLKKAQRNDGMVV